jgi:hypothetical protein
MGGIEAGSGINILFHDSEVMRSSDYGNGTGKIEDAVERIETKLSLPIKISGRSERVTVTTPQHALRSALAAQPQPASAQ